MPTQRPRLKRLRAALLCGALALAILPDTGKAATATSSFAVSATVLASCLVTATDLVFGNYSPGSGSPTDATNSVVVTCTPGTTYAVALDEGLGSGAEVNDRMMSYLTDVLQYGLYTSSAYTTVWGDGTFGTQTVSGTGDGTAQTLTVYGRIPAGQIVTPGAYADLITVTVTY